MNVTGDPLFDQYLLIVEDTARLSDRRQTVNNLYLSANSLLLGGLVFLVQQTEFKGFSTLFISALLVCVGMFLCYDWRRLLATYRALVGLRVQLLHKLEIQFTRNIELVDLISIYHEEDVLFDPDEAKKELDKLNAQREALKLSAQNRQAAQYQTTPRSFEQQGAHGAQAMQSRSQENEELGKNRKKKAVFGFSRIERNLPWLFTSIYLLMLLGTVILRYPEYSSQLAATGIHIPHLPHIG